MNWFRNRPRPARRARPLLFSAEPLERRELLTAYVQASANRGGGVYGIDTLGGLAHFQDGDTTTTHLDNLSINAISAGTTKAGQDNVLAAIGTNNELYLYTAAGGFVDQHGSLASFEDLTGGRAFGVGNDGALYRYQEGTGWTRPGGGGIQQYSAGATPTGEDVVWLKGGNSEIFEWRPSTGFVDLHVQMASVTVAPSGSYMVGYDGSVYHYSDAQGFSKVGGSNIATVSVGSTSNGQEDIYLRSTTGNLYYGTQAGVTQVVGQLKSIVASSNGGAYGVGYDGVMYHLQGTGASMVGGSDVDTIAVGQDSSGADEVFVHYQVVNQGVTVAKVAEYRPSSGFTLILDYVN